jgi:hypothetical protein
MNTYDRSSKINSKVVANCFIISMIFYVRVAELRDLLACYVISENDYKEVYIESMIDICCSF